MQKPNMNYKIGISKESFAAFMALRPTRMKRGSMVVIGACL
jgi:hypothetical protein